MMVPPELFDAAACARRGVPVTANPYPINGADYFRWHAAWHEAIARDPRDEAQRRDRERYRKLAEIYRQYANSAALTEMQ
ncbi:hypothetical protein [Zavarzinia compransoris]|uniref:Uncharacterized protein n=1 Tax=Zavarzinia compransoris TaxID=1264899 RepID=A0A317EDT7_9PROT|nr:hypothetical protein [Zavarzinia compransoris]PWR23375.1 hypothetical protein DKG75_02055 [Zavarzinia compransoris]TDP46052.1 hypothetical protein DES42_104133 [Zavarzinia compransoris]